MTDSILDSVKKTLNLPSEYEAFDTDIILHINSVFSTLNQLGIGPLDGFQIESKDETWVTFLEGDLRLNNVKTYMYLRVRMLFDPPTTGYHVDAMKQQITELEWRINAQRESVDWVDPDPDPIPEEIF